MATTYKDIQAEIRDANRISIKTCWIAHVKELNGAVMRKAPNRQSPTSRVHPCPEKYKPLIEASLRRAGIIG